MLILLSFSVQSAKKNNGLRTVFIKTAILKFAKLQASYFVIKYLKWNVVSLMAFCTILILQMSKLNSYSDTESTNYVNFSNSAILQKWSVAGKLTTKGDIYQETNQFCEVIELHQNVIGSEIFIMNFFSYWIWSSH